MVPHCGTFKANQVNLGKSPVIRALTNKATTNKHTNTSTVTYKYKYKYSTCVEVSSLQHDLQQHFILMVLYYRVHWKDREKMGEGGLWFLLTYQCTSRPDFGIKALLLTLHEACEKFLQCVQFIFLYSNFLISIFPFHQACIMDQTRPLTWQCTPWPDLCTVTEFKLC